MGGVKLIGQNAVQRIVRTIGNSLPPLVSVFMSRVFIIAFNIHMGDSRFNEHHS
ncbi:MAG: hypothetical protein QOJ40_354 [Verrucomicrobiota bacterium]